MIERGAEVANEIASGQANPHKLNSIDGNDCDGKELPFNIFICHNSIQLARFGSECSDGRLQSVQVHLRPLHFKISMLGYHDWPFLTYTYGRQRISEKQLSGSTWTLTFYGCGGHGNVRFTTNTAGTVGNTYRYDAFGMPIASTGTIANTYLYSGERFDSNLNLYHLRARYYNMLNGRFETMDPVAGNVLDWHPGIRLQQLG